MRITADAKTATRERILRSATRLFKSHGWQNTTTRDIAVAAEIATGTLFNYFPTKEAVVAELIRQALHSAAEEFHAGACAELSLEAELFALIWAGFSNLRELRKFLGLASETIFSPLARHSPSSAGDSIRVDHLELVDTIVSRHGFPSPRSAVTIQLYWTLYLGVFAFWAGDESPGQEDTLALLDQSLELFVASLRIDERKANI